jgi:hypothetical protein
VLKNLRIFLNVSLVWLRKRILENPHECFSLGKFPEEGEYEKTLAQLMEGISTDCESLFLLMNQDPLVFFLQAESHGV